MKRKLDLSTVLALVLMAAALTFSLTYLYARDVMNSYLSDNSELMTELKKYGEVRKYIDDDFIGGYDEGELLDGAMDGMIGALGDKWSYYMTAEEYEKYKLSSNNEYAGLGITVTKDEATGGLFVNSVYAGSPAEKAGLVTGDVILYIDGEDITGKAVSEASVLIPSKAGESVFLVVRAADGSKKNLTATCEVITTIPVTSELLDGGVGLVTIKNFDYKAASSFRECVNSLIDRGAGALIFDVRYDPGGKVTELVDILDMLLPAGNVFITRDKAGGEKIYKSGASCIDTPAAVLVNQYSYSAAEFFAAALQEYGRATVVGEKTTGKGYSQDTIPLSDGSALHISTKEYFTPKGVNLAGIGVTPDLEVSLDGDKGALLYSGKLGRDDDAQLQAAKEVLLGGVQ